MNIVLLQPHELGDDAVAVLRDQRAVHIRGVLKAAVGDSLRVGVLGGRCGQGVIEADRPDGVRPGGFRISAPGSGSPGRAGAAR